MVWEYDAMGRKSKLIDGSGTNEWAYDAASRVVTHNQSRANATVAYSYNAESRRLSMTVNGAQTLYDYDNAGRLTSLSNQAGVFTYAWRPGDDRIQTVMYPNGAQVSNRYDILGRLLDMQNVNSTGGVVSQFAYHYNGVGLKTNLTMADGRQLVFGYDSVRQLMTAQGYQSGGGSDTNYQYSYGYDPIGNYTQAIRQTLAEVFKANNLNQYTNTTVYPALMYDANGNLLNDSQMQYVWDEENRLVNVTNGSQRSEFVYNGWGWRVERREYSNGVPTETVRYIYDGLMPVAELDG